MFNRLIAVEQGIVGTPTLLETRMVLTARIPSQTDQFVGGLLGRPSIHPVAFTLEMYSAAVEAFRRYGKGGGHPAALNFGDCLSYAVASVHRLPLLYKGEDFGRTDIRPALR